MSDGGENREPYGSPAEHPPADVSFYTRERGMFQAHSLPAGETSFGPASLRVFRCAGLVRIYWSSQCRIE